jgi:Tfp pilus assembly protein PilN
VSLQQINLLNPQLLTAQVAFSSKTIAWTLLGVVVSGLLVYGWVERNAGGIQLQQDQVQAVRDALQARIDAQSQPSEAGVTPEDQRSQAVAEEKRRVAQLQQLQAALGMTQGEVRFSTSLHALANEGLPGVWLTDIEFGRSDFRLKGRALQPDRIPDYLALLSRQPALQDLPLSRFDILPRDEEKEDAAAAPGVAFAVNQAEDAQ